MDLQFVTRHLVSGYIPVAAALTIFFAVCRVFGKKQTGAHIAASFVFCFYLVGILTMTGVCIKGSFSPRIAWIPFVDMIRGPVDTVLNVFLFIPLGFFLPVMYGKFDRVGMVAAIGFLVSLSVELAQMFDSGTTDINDLITNTVGACLGYGVFWAVHRAFPNGWVKRIREEGSWCYVELLFFWISAVVIMITIQITIFHTLFT
ncbi:MAG: VanZ family protein [Oscillospiraceae bacterium]|nr:VanZ family protein [Oscillospiraceae bacterium]